jgi:hypothetical protein
MSVRFVAAPEPPAISVTDAGALGTRDDGHTTGPVPQWSTGLSERGMTAITLPESPEKSPAPGTRVMSLGRWLRTTPGCIRLFSIAAVVSLALLWATGTSALTARRDAARSVGLQSAPQLTRADDLYAALADADATASGALLRKGLEPDSVRRRYLGDLEGADRLLVAVSAQANLSPTVRAATRAIATRLPAYTGRVETARTNSRLGNPVGAAYMREASAQMRNEILPAATTIWKDAARRLNEDYRNGTAGRHLTSLALVGALTALVLVAALVYTARRTNRVLNLGLLGATALAILLVGWSVVQMVRGEDALVRAQREGSDAVQVLSVARTLALQAQADASLALIERGAGQSYVEEFKVIMQRLGGTDGQHGLLGYARAVVTRAGNTADTDGISHTFVHYAAVQTLIRDKDANGDYDGAVELSLSEDSGGLSAAAHRLDTRLQAATGAARARFTSAATDARAGFAALIFAMAAAMVIAAAFVLVGLQRRIGEYR